VAAGELLAQTLQANHSDPYAIAKGLGAQALDIAGDLDKFATSAGSTLPPKALAAIRSLLDNYRMRMRDGGLEAVDRLRVTIVPLAWLKAEVDYHLTDSEAVAVRLSERAFVHLQQLIVADPAVQGAWSKAFSRDEPACESMGGAHLLAHGIWAFKAHGPGARTDLVFAEPLGQVAAPERVADAMVLTEWKLVKDPAKHEEIAAAARNQAELYGRGVLGGMELLGYRYIVLVSRKRLAPIADVTHSNTVYRHINIAVEPEVPSKAA
jgi:hypothetical protein